MNISFITDEYSQDIEEAIAFANESGIGRIEIRSLWGKNVSRLTPNEIVELNGILRQGGIGVSCLDSFAYKGAWSHELRKAGLGVVDHLCDVAVTLGARYVRVFAFWKEGAPSLDVIADDIGKAGDLARDRGIDLLVENGTFSCVGQGSDLKRLLELVAMENVKALWDPGNVLNGGWSETTTAGLASLERMVAHVHVKNPHSGPPGAMEYGLIKGGMVNWGTQIEMLRTVGFEGDLSLETHWRKNRTVKGRVMLDFPEGEQFSSGGTEPTRQMVRELKTILDGEEL